MTNLEMAKIIFEIKYAYADVKIFDRFYNMNCLLAEKIGNDEIDGSIILNSKDGASGVQKLMNTLEKKLINGRALVKGFSENFKVLPDIAVDMLTGIKTEEHTSGTDVVLSCNRSDKCDIYVDKRRAGENHISGVTLSDDVRINVRSNLATYMGEAYSIALNFANDAIAIKVVSDGSGQKGGATVEVIYIDENSIYIDRLDKYTNIDGFIKGISI